jgi:hypothetical protein
MTFTYIPVHSSWWNDSLSPQELGERVSNMLHELERVDPAMDNWLLGGPKSLHGVSFAKAAVDLPKFIQGCVVLDDWRREDSASGYRIVISGSEVPQETNRSDAINLRMTVGAEFQNRVNFEVGEPHLPRNARLTSYPIYKGGLIAISHAWQCPWTYASYYSRGSPRAGGHPEKPSPFDLAWIAYLSAPLAAGLQAPADLTVESTPGGGMILSAVETMLDQGNPDHVRRTQLLEEILIERIGLSPTVFGPAYHDARKGPF